MFDVMAAVFGRSSQFVTVKMIVLINKMWHQLNVFKKLSWCFVSFYLYDVISSDQLSLRHECLSPAPYKSYCAIEWISLTYFDGLLSKQTRDHIRNLLWGPPPYIFSKARNHTLIGQIEETKENHLRVIVQVCSFKALWTALAK